MYIGFKMVQGSKRASGDTGFRVYGPQFLGRRIKGLTFQGGVWDVGFRVYVLEAHGHLEPVPVMQNPPITFNMTRKVWSCRGLHTYGGGFPTIMGSLFGGSLE